MHKIVYTITLPLKLKIISHGLNMEGYVFSKKYCLVLQIPCDLRGINCKK